MAWFDTVAVTLRVSLAKEIDKVADTIMIRTF